MSPITRRDFQSSSPLEPSVSQALQEAFAQGWVEAQKIHHQSAAFRIKIAAARESIAKNLGLEIDEVEFVGELGFGFWSAISGLLRGARADSPLIHSQIDRQIIHAFAREESVTGRASFQAPVKKDGRFDLEPYLEKCHEPIVIWQGTNRETGVEQSSPDTVNNFRLFADMTARFDLASLPKKWDVALWDPRSFGAPEGLAIIGVRRGSSWKSPIPQMDGRRLFGSFSKPLLIATAVALEIWTQNAEQNRRKLSELNSYARRMIQKMFPELSIVGEAYGCDPRNLAIAIPGAIAEELLRSLELKEILIDAGSACGAGALSPSHVLDAMGFANYAHIRLTFKVIHERADIDALLSALQELLKRD